MRDIDTAEEWLDAWTASVDAQAARAAELSRRVAALTGTARSEDGSIKVTVGSSGQVRELELDDRVRRLPGAELARQIMSVMGRAQAGLSTKVADEVRATVGTETETGRAVIHSFQTRFPSRAADEPDGGDDERQR